MSESLRRKSYVGTRVLIESSRVLNPQFDDGVLHISGAQLEMLRNITQYLGRQDTFVDEYQDDYYIMPDSVDWDIITSIVAGLEEVLMGNNNVIFGYFEMLKENMAGVIPSGTTYSKWTSTVQAGELWVVQVCSVKSKDTVPTIAEFLVDTGITNFELLQVASPGIDVPVVFSDSFVLASGGRIQYRATDCVAGDAFSGYVWGYKMQVPT